MRFSLILLGRRMDIQEWERNFQSLLHQISQDLTQGDVESLKFLLQQDISQSKLEKVQSGTKIFTLMQNLEILSYQNTRRLESLLKEIGRRDLVLKLKEFEKELQQSISVPYNVTKEKQVGHFQKTEALVCLEKLMEEHPVVTISGPLGVGKSQAAIAFGIDLQKRNSDCVVWKCIATSESTLLRSLRSLAEKLSINVSSPIWSDTDDKNNFSLIAEKLKEQLHKREVKSFYHLIVLDDVKSHSSKSVQILVRSILTTEDTNIKILITTTNRSLLRDYETLDFIGFTPAESLDFFTMGKEIDKERTLQYKKLAEEMGNLPLGLYIAKTYMKNMHIGPNDFLQLLKRENIDDIESQLTDIDEIDHQSTNINLFTAMKLCIYEDLKREIKSNKVFAMFQMTQFLENENIPICLLEFAFREKGFNEKSETMIMANSLVLALQKRSLGIVEGEGDNRRLSVHSAVTFSLGLFTEDEEKRNLLKNLLWGFSLLMDKDVFINTDLLRMKLLIPHAKSFLKKAEEFHLTAEYDNLILMTFVYNIVGFGHNFGLFKTMSNEYSEESKNCCFKIIECKEEEIDGSLKAPCDTYDENSVEFYKFRAKGKSEVLWEKLDQMAASKNDILTEIVPKFILQRFRTESNMQDLAKHLDIDISDLIINDGTYKTLVEKQLALSFDRMTRFFLHEIVLSVFYTYGRHLFYQRQKPGFREARKMVSYLFLAKEIGGKLREKQKELPPINALLSEIRGVLQSRVEDEAQFYQDKMTNFQGTIEEAYNLSELEEKYHVFGIFKMDASVSNRINCLKIVIRCQTKMLQLKIDTKTKQRLSEEGCKIADEILELVKNLGNRRNINGYKVRVAEFYISVEKITLAEKLFQDIFPSNVFEMDCITSLKRHEITAGYGLVKCYELTSRQEDADKLKSKLNEIDK